MMPSCDQIGVPIHFHSSTTSGSASLMSLRILLRVSPRQSPSSAILFEMSSDADWLCLARDSFMFSSWKLWSGARRRGDYPLARGMFRPWTRESTVALKAELRCVLGVESLPAAELHRLG